jgi:phage tail sheath gpL-like
MPVSFSNIPQNIKQPLYWVELDSSMAGLPTSRQPALLVGQMLSAGNATPNVPIAIGTLAQARRRFGVGSMLARMFDVFMRNNVAHEMWALPLVEPSGGVKATGTITVTTQQTAGGTLHLYIAGQLVTVGVAAGDTKVQLAAKIMVAINDVNDLPVTATMVSGDHEVVTLTCKWKGSTGNDIDMRDNFRGTIGGERMPEGLLLTYSNSGKLTGASGEPSVTNGIANLSDEPFEYVALPFTDGTTIDAFATEYGFDDSGRWGWMRQQYGIIFSARRDEYSDLITWGETNNEATISFMGVDTDSPTPVWEWAAAYTGKAARAFLNDPARPLQTLELVGIKPAREHMRFSIGELNALAGSGIATQKTGPNKLPMIQRETMAYQLNLYGQGDDAYELATTLATLATLIRNQRQAITSKYPRHKLADDGTRFGVGQKIVTPSIIKAELVAQYRIDEFNGLVENLRAFKQALIVERDSNNPNRLNVLYPPDLINQLRVFAVLAQFRLQYDRGIDLQIAA